MSKKFKQIEVNIGGKTHYLREYEVGKTFANKMKFIVDNCPFTPEDLADLFFVGVNTILSWAKGTSIPEDKNIITAVNKYYRFLYERVMEEGDDE